MFWIIRRLLLPVLVLLVLAGGAAYLLLAHQVDRSSLSYSLANSPVATHVGDGLVADCAHSHRSDWVCSLQATDGSDAGIVYFMTTRGHCWTARLSANTSGFKLPDRATGCVGILDQLRIGDRIRGVLGSAVNQAGYY